MPRDLTALDDRELMILFGEMTAWVEYHGALLSKAEVAERRAEALLEVRRAQALVGKAAKSVSAAKASASSDPSVQEAQEKYLDAYAARKREEVAYVNADRNAALISRELTRRANRSDREYRNDRWNP